MTHGNGGVPSSISVVNDGSKIGFRLVRGLAGTGGNVLVDASPCASPIVKGGSGPCHCVHCSIGRAGANSIFFDVTRFGLFRISTDIISPRTS